MYLISYDLSNDKLRNKLAKVLENYGKRVQYSVFECRLNQTQLKTLYAQMADIMQEEEKGSVRIYTFCKNCQDKVYAIGVEEIKEDDSLIII